MIESCACVTFSQAEFWLAGVFVPSGSAGAAGADGRDGQQQQQKRDLLAFSAGGLRTFDPVGITWPALESTFSTQRRRRSRSGVRNPRPTSCGPPSRDARGESCSENLRSHDGLFPWRLCRQGGQPLANRHFQHMLPSQGVSMSDWMNASIKWMNPLKIVQTILTQLFKMTETLLWVIYLLASRPFVLYSLKKTVPGPDSWIWNVFVAFCFEVRLNTWELNSFRHFTAFGLIITANDLKICILYFIFPWNFH